MSEPPEPTQDTPSANQSGGFNFGDLTSQRDTNVTISDSAGRDKIENTTIFNFFKPSQDVAERLAQRNRQTMLLKVKAYWIDGVLANSLHSKVIPLGMEHKPDAVTQPRPWDMLWQHRDPNRSPLARASLTVSTTPLVIPCSFWANLALAKQQCCWS